ncbi:unnamed protein product [Larinioides sclopetarius]|uniref:Mediator of RNA polymerase II transcription subunit 8 n=1 Tax=Larinioides sclopetarius TaxID=280406 RepID=A0AAV2BHV8_9ARAC
MCQKCNKEEKALDMVVEALINRCQDLKNIISSFIMKLENENLSWPHVLDNFALISGQVNTVLKILRNEKSPALRNRVLLPLLLNPDRDEELAVSINLFNAASSFFLFNVFYINKCFF